MIYVSCQENLDFLHTSCRKSIVTPPGRNLAHARKSAKGPFRIRMPYRIPHYYKVPKQELPEFFNKHLPDMPASPFGGGNEMFDKIQQQMRDLQEKMSDKIQHPV